MRFAWILGNSIRDSILDSCFRGFRTLGPQDSHQVGYCRSKGEELKRTCPSLKGSVIRMSVWHGSIRRMSLKISRKLESPQAFQSHDVHRLVVGKELAKGRICH